MASLLDLIKEFEISWQVVDELLLLIKRNKQPSVNEYTTNRLHPAPLTADITATNHHQIAVTLLLNIALVTDDKALVPYLQKTNTLIAFYKKNPSEHQLPAYALMIRYLPLLQKQCAKFNKTFLAAAGLRHMAQFFIALSTTSTEDKLAITKAQPVLEKWYLIAGEIEESDKDVVTLSQKVIESKVLLANYPQSRVLRQCVRDALDVMSDSNNALSNTAKTLLLNELLHVAPLSNDETGPIMNDVSDEVIDHAAAAIKHGFDPIHPTLDMLFTATPLLQQELGDGFITAAKNLLKILQHSKPEAADAEWHYIVCALQLFYFIERVQRKQLTTAVEIHHAYDEVTDLLVNQFPTDKIPPRVQMLNYYSKLMKAQFLNETLPDADIDVEDPENFPESFLIVLLKIEQILNTLHKAPAPKMTKKLNVAKQVLSYEERLLALHEHIITSAACFKSVIKKSTFPTETLEKAVTQTLEVLQLVIASRLRVAISEIFPYLKDLILTLYTATPKQAHTFWLEMVAKWQSFITYLQNNFFDTNVVMETYIEIAEAIQPHHMAFFTSRMTRFYFDLLQTKVLPAAQKGEAEHSAVVIKANGKLSGIAAKIKTKGTVSSTTIATKERLALIREALVSRLPAMQQQAPTLISLLLLPPWSQHLSETSRAILMHFSQYATRIGAELMQYLGGLSLWSLTYLKNESIEQDHVLAIATTLRQCPDMPEEQLPSAQVYTLFQKQEKEATTKLNYSLVHSLYTVCEILLNTQEINALKNAKQYLLELTNAISGKLSRIEESHLLLLLKAYQLLIRLDNKLYPGTTNSVANFGVRTLLNACIEHEKLKRMMTLPLYQTLSQVASVSNNNSNAAFKNPFDLKMLAQTYPQFAATAVNDSQTQIQILLSKLKQSVTQAFDTATPIQTKIDLLAQLEEIRSHLQQEATVTITYYNDLLTQLVLITAALNTPEIDSKKLHNFTLSLWQLIAAKFDAKQSQQLDASLLLTYYVILASLDESIVPTLQQLLQTKSISIDVTLAYQYLQRKILITNTPSLQFIINLLQQRMKLETSRQNKKIAHEEKKDNTKNVTSNLGKKNKKPIAESVPAIAPSHDKVHECTVQEVVAHAENPTSANETETQADTLQADKKPETTPKNLAAAKVTTEQPQETDNTATGSGDSNEDIADADNDTAVATKTTKSEKQNSRNRQRRHEKRAKLRQQSHDKKAAEKLGHKDQEKKTEVETSSNVDNAAAALLIQQPEVITTSKQVVPQTEVYEKPNPSVVQALQPEDATSSAASPFLVSANITSAVSTPASQNTDKTEEKKSNWVLTAEPFIPAALRQVKAQSQPAATNHKIPAHAKHSQPQFFQSPLLPTPSAQPHYPAQPPYYPMPNTAFSNPPSHYSTITYYIPQTGTTFFAPPQAPPPYYHHHIYADQNRSDIVAPAPYYPTHPNGGGNQ